MLQLCINSALSVSMETGQNVVYIDTGGAFDISRIQDMLDARDIEEKVRHVK